jgi:hypothetical protein
LTKLKDIIKIIEDIRNERPEYGKTADLYELDTLLKIVDAVQGHPLAASNAVKYIIRVLSQHKEATAGRRFVAMMASNNFQAPQHFLCWKPDSPLIMETFKVSQIRLSKPEAGTFPIVSKQCFGLLRFLRATSAVLTLSESHSSLNYHATFIYRVKGR